MAAVKIAPYFTPVLLYFFRSIGIILPSTFIKSVLRVVKDVALFHYPSCTDSIKSSLQFSCNFAVFNSPES
jgi:hypothetical protein